MEGGFLLDFLILYIDREIAMKVTMDFVIDDFNTVKNPAVKFKWARYIDHFCKLFICVLPLNN